jgi:membrane fusion protein, multidrug efflux system
MFSSRLGLAKSVMENNSCNLQEDGFAIDNISTSCVWLSCKAPMPFLKPMSDAGVSGATPQRLPVLAAILLCSLGLVACSPGQKASADAPSSGKGGRRGAGGPVPVSITKVSQRDVPVDVQVVGNVEAYSTITVKGQVTGELTRVSFHEGDFVKAGDLLFTVDSRPLQAQLQQAEATLAKNLAQAKQAEANLAKDRAQQQYSRTQATRYTQLMKEGIISKDQNDQVQAAYDAVTQSLEADKASIDSARADANATRAMIENLKVQLEYTAIRSPISGRTGNLNVKQGNLITANVTELMTINQVQPIYVTFSVPEARLQEIKQFQSAGHVAVFVSLQDNDPAPERGILTFIDNNVDTTTGTIKLKATLPNTDRKLWPGQFVRVTMRLTTRANAAVVPNQAVQTGQDGTYVYVVKADNSVESRPVTTGARVDQDLVVERGLTPGETVVTEGQLRLAPGMKIMVRDPSQVPGTGSRRSKS